MGFDIQPHMKFMRELWDEHIQTQKDNSIILKPKGKELRETRYTSSIEMVGAVPPSRSNKIKIE